MARAVMMWAVCQRLICISTLMSITISATFGADVRHETSGVAPRIYHGTIKENSAEGTEVDLNIPLMVSNWEKLTGGEVCGYTLYKWHSELPFRVVLTDRTTGKARLVLDSGHRLDYETKHRYSFEVAPFDCLTGVHGLREKVHVKVEDVNEFAPKWKEDFYSGFVEEGKLSEEILKVEATDSDGSTVYSNICNYHIVTDAVPFEINDKGVLRNTVVLSSVVQSRYKLEVTSEDCGGRVSDKVDVEVEVEATCRPTWTGVDDEVEASGMMKRPLAPGAALELCDSTCTPTLISVTVELETTHISKGCDRDTHSIRIQRKLCGSSSPVFSLLPSPTGSDSWTVDLPLDGSGEDADQATDPAFVFDGETAAVEVPLYVMDPVLGPRFSVSVWMKHDNSGLTSGSSVGNKEHIMCNSDGEGMSRHHYALFVRNCHLTLLMRQEPSPPSSSSSSSASVDRDEDSEDGGLKPAEWRWTMAEVCDARWHHYTINVDFPQVRLFVDGVPFTDSENNPEILDDWPLRQTADVHTTKLVIGACWQGGKNRMSQHFRGTLSGLTILRNETDSDGVVHCLNNCQEKLDINGLDNIVSETSVSMNTRMNVMTINGLELDSVEQLLHQISYVNGRVVPTPGERPITIRTDVKCSDEQQHLQVETLNLTLLVRESEPIEVVLNGSKSLMVDEVRLSSTGEFICPNLTITTRVKSYQNNEYGQLQQRSFDRTDSLLLDSCAVRVEPKLDPGIEQISLLNGLADLSDLDLTQNENGIVISGVDKLQTYEMLLRQVRYSNSRPEHVNSRSFLISCSVELNQRFFSNQFQVQVEVVHVTHLKSPSSSGSASASAAAAAGPPSNAGHAAPPAAMTVNRASHPVMSDNLRMIVKSFPNSLKYDSQETGIGVAVVMVVCIGFVIMLIILGVMRVRSGQNLGSDDDPDDPKANPEWDNSTLTITVNPMDPDNVANGEEVANTVAETDSDGEEVVYRSNKKSQLPPAQAPPAQAPAAQALPAQADRAAPVDDASSRVNIDGQRRAVAPEYKSTLVL